jgi:hypothetical protein
MPFAVELEESQATSPSDHGEFDNICGGESACVFSWIVDGGAE